MAARLILTLLAVLAATCLAIPTISVKGAKFFTSDGKQFFLKGIAYQLTPDDPLINPTQCQLDADLMKTLGANSIRVYHVDPAADHDACMKTFADAGIYAWIDLDTFSTYIIGETPEWTTRQLSAYQEVMDVFQKYDNVGGFFVGNEVLTKGSESRAAPYVKAAARDLKAYRDKKGYRKIPVGYSAADIAELRPNLQNYMACGSDPAASLDFFSLNAYEWCGTSDYQASGYSQLQKNATGYSIPLYFSETGCIVPKPRNFGDQAAIFGPEMSGTWSGAIIYEWIEEANGYGLISYGPAMDPSINNADVQEGFKRTGTPVPIEPDFSNLKDQWSKISPSTVSEDDYKPNLTPPACPEYTPGLWEVNVDAVLPQASSDTNPPSATGTPLRNTGGATHSTTTSAAAKTSILLATTPAPTGTAATTTSAGAAAASTTAAAGANRLSVPFF